MGIPYFFKSCIDEYDNIYIPSNLFDLNINNLFLDLNCAIHPCAANESDEDIIIQKIIDKIDELVKLTNLNNLLYIAIDGPAPKAKMIQQKQRRFNNDKKLWDTNAISPGTKFMDKLNLKLKEIKYNFKIIISDSNEPGEGEHKIMQYLNNNNNNNINIIYGLDADLIMLSLIQKNNIYLLRERTEFNIEKINDDYIYFNINKLKDHIYNHINLSSNYDLKKDTVINDYIFLCFLLGNDFIHPIPSLNIRYNGIHILLNYYIELQNNFFGKFYIIDLKSNNLINNLQLLFQKLSQNENKDIFNILKKRKKENLNKKIDNLILDRSDENYIFNDIDLWELKYYNYFINNSKIIYPNTKDNLELDISKISYNYLESLCWTANYYFKEKIDWRWYYQYNYSPSSKDIYKLLLKNNNIKLKKNNPYQTIHQLIQILPQKSFHLLPNNIINKLKDYDYMYPIKINKNYILKKYEWEGHGYIPLFTDQELISLF